MTNHILRFLSIDRADPRKFEVLQIIASMLEWTDGTHPSHRILFDFPKLTLTDQLEQAGLARPGASNINLRTPIAPWHRTPSTPSLASNDVGDGDSRGRTESIGGLFSKYLEKESESGGTGSRSESVTSSTRKLFG